MSWGNALTGQNSSTKILNTEKIQQIFEILFTISVFLSRYLLYILTLSCCMLEAVAQTGFFFYCVMAVLQFPTGNDLTPYLSINPAGTFYLRPPERRRRPKTAHQIIRTVSKWEQRSARF